MLHISAIPKADILHARQTNLSSEHDVYQIRHNFLHSRSLRLCISSVRFLTQSQSATVYFICMISYTVAVLVNYVLWLPYCATVFRSVYRSSSYTVAVCDCVFHLYDFFLLLTQSQSATVYFFCTISSSSSSYTVAVCDCVFLLYDFFLLLLSTLQRLISSLCLDRFRQNFFSSISSSSHLCYWGQRSRRGHRGQKR